VRQRCGAIDEVGVTVTLADVRAFIAHRLLESTASSEEEQLGSITLRPYQQTAVNRLRVAISESGGALLCDQVGMGKTFVALALCERGASVVAPAVLKDMWDNAARSAGRLIVFISTESLSRNERPASASDQLLIVDEAHHFRNPRTKRYAALAKLAATRPVVMLTATPVHNRRQDLTALLSLFLGSSSESLTQSELSRLIVRREIESVGGNSGFPQIEQPVWCDLNHDDEIPRLLLDLPPPLPPRGGGDGGALVIHSLLRQWSSSGAALERALVRRLQRSFAMISALENGTYPSQTELSAWTSAEDSVQLAFAELVATGSQATEALLPVVRKHRDAVSSLLNFVRTRRGLDDERVGVIRVIREQHSRISLVAFSQYADTIGCLFRELSRDGGVAALTGDGARVSGGRLSRREAIGRFAPIASGVKAPRAADAITLLLTTDLLSEGVNLQDAGVVIHLDLPWTPARMEQRLGRVARMGSRHESVFSYVMRPPASIETLIHLERVLRDKVEASSHVVDVFPSLSLTGDSRALENAPRVSESIRSTLEEWTHQSVRVEISEPCFAAVSAPIDGFLALCRADDGIHLIAGTPGGPSSDPVRVVAVMQHCVGDEVPADSALIDKTVLEVTRYFDGLRITEGTGTTATVRVKRDGLKRIARIVGRARLHDRVRVASLASGARSSLMSRIGADGEQRLESLSNETLSDDSWMEEVAKIGNQRKVKIGKVEVIAAILLVARQETVTRAKER
jgi:superfamily II DNA or RNA helicase